MPQRLTTRHGTRGKARIDGMGLSNARTSQGATPRLLARQRQLLLLLDTLGGAAGNLDFQKLLFLYCQEPDSGRPYDFVPYKFGACSFTSYADRRKLIACGFLAEDEYQWQLTEEGRHAIGRTLDLQLTAFARRYRHMRGAALVAETYRKFPYYATRSAIAKRILHDDTPALERIAAMRSAAKPVAVSTIGYEGRTLESYLNALLHAGVTLLCDVRRNPISRKYGFAKGTLAKGCEGVGIRYEHLPELGIASEQRQHLETHADYDVLFATYTRQSLPKQTVALATIAG
jgi:uncharacterized protein (DUF488 family)